MNHDTSKPHSFDSMKILAIEPYYGGSHKAFLDGWLARSSHDWTLLTLPARKWKWRMRHAAVTLAEDVAARIAGGESWDLLFCCDMLNLAEFLGLSPNCVRRLPSAVYFHENQLTYPTRCESERDFHYGFTNMTTALAAYAVWFNSAYHRESFLDALMDVLRRMPDYQPLHAIGRIRDKSVVQPPGIDELPPRNARTPGPLHILWAARWEHDKNPETFFEAIGRLESRRIPFRLSVIGEQFRDAPAVFGAARERFAEHIEHWGYLESRDEYVAALAGADVFVSTANHEFFGISAAEAIAAGAFPVLPDRLAYPELVDRIDSVEPGEFLYSGGADGLSDRLALLAERIDSGGPWRSDPQRGIRAMAELTWRRRAAQLDAALSEVASGFSRACG